MRNILKKMKKIFSKDIELSAFDSGLFLVKVFITCVVAYLLLNSSKQLSKDRISFLFALVLTLEPVTYSSIKNGLAQVRATLYGGISAFLIVSVLGINTVSFALAIVAAIFTSLKFESKQVSPVAVFTAIYMTQLVQYNVDGSINYILTLSVRMFSLLSGILVAIIVNGLFSLFGYRSMERKRTAFLLKTYKGKMKLFIQSLRSEDDSILVELENSLPTFFIKLDYVKVHIEDLEKESDFFKRLFNIAIRDRISDYKAYLAKLRYLAHVLFDLVYISKNEMLDIKVKNELADCIEILYNSFEMNYITELKNTNAFNPAVLRDLYEMEKSIKVMKQTGI